MLVFALRQMWTLGQPPAVVVGQLAEVTTWQGRRTTNYALTLSDGRRFTWDCGASGCRRAEEQVKALRWETPLTVTLQLHGAQVVGLTARDVEIVSSELDAPRQTKGMLILLAIGVFAAVVALANYLQRRPGLGRRKAALRRGHVKL